MRCFKKVAFPKRPELKWHEMVTKTMMLSCVNTIFLNNLSLTEHIIPFWKLIHLRKISLWRLLLLRMHEKEVANHACAFLNRLKKYKKKATIYKYKYIQNSQSIKEGMNASFWHLLLQHWNTFLWVFSYKSNSNMYHTISTDRRLEMHGMLSECDSVWKEKRYERWKQSATIIVCPLFLEI